MEIQITDLYFKPTIEFFNIEVLDKQFTGIKKNPSVYVIRFEGNITGAELLEFNWLGVNYKLIGPYEHSTSSDWRIIECEKWYESKI